MVGGVHGRERAWHGWHAWRGSCMTGGMRGWGGCVADTTRYGQ